LPKARRKGFSVTHKIAVVGCGYWGPNLVRNFRSLPGVTVGKICDKNRERLEYVGQLYPEVDRTTDFSAVTHDNSIDMVAIATPVSTHHPLAFACLEAGKHIFVEKPLASTSAQCRELVTLADVHALTLMVGHTFVYTTTVRKIKEIVDSGEIGELMYISCRRLNLGLFQKDINVAWDLAPHDISIILYIMGGSPLSVSCQGKAHVSPGIEDITNMSLVFKNGGFATIQSSWIDPRKVREITIVGTRKMIVYDDTEPLEKIKIYDKRVEAPPHYDTFGEFQYSYHYGDILSPFVKHVEPLRIECQHFVDCVEKCARPDSSGIEGLEVVRILEAATESLRTGGGTVPLETRA
jgi:predicted dehydrogenase